MDSDSLSRVMSPYIDITCIDQYANMEDAFIRIVCKLYRKNGDTLIMESGPLKFIANHRILENTPEFIESITEGNIYEFIGLITTNAQKTYQMEVSHYTTYNKGYDMEQYPNLVKLWHDPKYKDLFFPNKR